MKKETGLVELLYAEWQRARALLMMQDYIEIGDFEYAMRNQLEYLYWHDEFKRLFNTHGEAYWKRRMAAHGTRLVKDA